MNVEGGYHILTLISISVSSIFIGIVIGIITGWLLAMNAFKMKVLSLKSEIKNKN